MRDALTGLVSRLRPWMAPLPLSALLVALLAVAPALLVAGILATRAGGDSPFLLERVYEMAEALVSGQVPPRWMPDGAFGLGYPFWNYYAPLAYLFAGVVAVLGGGVVGAIKVTTLLCFLAAAAGMYRLGARTWGAPGAGLVASAAYTLAPYHLVNLYVRGDALSELAAYAVFPWLLLALDAARQRHSAGAVAALGLAMAALVTSHNISALMFLVVVALILVWPRDRRDKPAPAPDSHVPQARGTVDANVPPAGWWTAPAAWVLSSLYGLEWRSWGRWRRWRGRGVLAVLAGLGLGLALAAWFWMPALLERDEVQLAENTTGYFSYDNHFRALDIVDVHPMFDYSTDGGHEPWQTGLVQLLVAAAGALVAWRLKDRRRTLWLWVVLAVAATFMVTPLSQPLWAHVPLLPYIQFPWRWLSVQAFALALVSAPLGLGRPWRAYTVVALLMLAALPGLVVQTLSVQRVARPDITAFEVFSNNPGTTVRGEYLPRAVAPHPHSSVDAVYGREGDPRAISGSATATMIRHGATYQEWQVEVDGDQAATLAFPTLWFPGWTATLQQQPKAPVIQGSSPSGEPIPTPTPLPPPDPEALAPRATGVMPGSGWLTLEIPPGRYLVRLNLGRSDIRAVAEGLSLVAWLLLLALLLANRRRAWRVGLLALAGGFLLAIVVARLMPVGRATGPVTVDTSQSAWPHANPAGLWFGDAHLTAGAPQSDEVVAGQDLSIPLAWQVPVPPGYTVTLELVSPAQPVFGQPDIHASVEAPLTDGEEQLALHVPPDTPDGLYFVRMTMKDGERTVPAESADGVSLAALLKRQAPRFRLGEVYLGPVRIRGADGSASTVSPVEHMGPVDLQAVSTRQQGDALRVDMTWQSDKRLAAEYKTSVRLLDPSGKVIAQDDSLPLYGYFPSTAWRANRPWSDRRWLKLPADITPGNGYAVQVVLYTEAPAAEIGKARVPGVTIQAVPKADATKVKGTD